jgi:protein arginine kinase activator
MEQSPERHIECSECKKPIAIIYTEIVGKMIYKVAMCKDCPMLRQKLYGTHSHITVNPESLAAGLCCGGCGTTADEVKMSVPLGCQLCYEVFSDLILQELALQERLPFAQRGKKEAPMHLGKRPGQSTEVTPAMKLVALHQALHETLKREDYEQAAWLRDQIKALTETKESEKARGKGKDKGGADNGQKSKQQE